MSAPIIDNLFDAARENDILSIIRLHKSGHHLEAIDKQGRTPLMVALSAGQLEAVRVLLVLRAHTCWIGREEEDAFSSVPRGRVDLYWALITHDAHYSFKYYTYEDRLNGALTHAIGNADTESIVALLDNGVPINPVRKRYYSLPLYSAVYLSNYSWQDKQNPTMEIDPENESLRESDFLPIIQLLLDRGADIHAEDDQAIRDAATFQNKPLVDLLRKNGARYGICEAAALGDVEEVRRLLDQGADIETPVKKDDDDDTPLSLAAGRGYTELVSLLLERGANIHPYPQKYNLFQPLAGAVGGRHYDCAVLLCKHGAAKTNHEALHIAIDTGEERFVRLLLQYGVPLDGEVYDRTPIQFARHQEQEHIVRLLEKIYAEDTPGSNVRQ